MRESPEHLVETSHVDLVDDTDNRGIHRHEGLRQSQRSLAPPDPGDDIPRTRVLVGVAGDNVVRMAPPLNISTRDIDRAVTILHRAFLDVRQGISE